MSHMSPPPRRGNEDMQPKYNQPKIEKDGTPLPVERLLSFAAAARYLGTTLWAVRCLVWDGALPHVRLGRRHLVDVKDLDLLVERLKTRDSR